MDVVKDIAAILGVILSAASIITLLSKRVRHSLTRTIRKYGDSDEREAAIIEIKKMLEQHIEDDRIFKDEMKESSEISLEFTKAQCRNIIKNIFYRYCDTKIIPLYEKKTLMYIDALYIGRLHCNTFASLLLNEMFTWEVDYSNNQADECFAEDH